LLDEIMPKVWAAEPSLRLHLVGSNFPPEILATGEADERVAVHGWVQDLGEVFDRVRISVAPLRYGAGLKGKVGDSLARGVPVVATPIGAEGFGDVQDSLAVAESADDLAAAIIGLHDDESDWRVRREIGIDLVGRHFGPDAARSQLQEVVDRALPS
jgi:glycosyltransferase involved in cell wall biosynthesis